MRYIARKENWFMATKKAAKKAPKASAKKKK
jgi:hypothetical protein